jgi:hypothetical protein
MRNLRPGAPDRANDDQLTQLLGSLQSVTASGHQEPRAAASSRATARRSSRSARRPRMRLALGMNNAWGTHKAVRVKLGAVARPALVKQLRQRGAGPIEQGNFVGEFYEFVRWIDDDMTAMAGPDDRPRRRQGPGPRPGRPHASGAHRQAVDTAMNSGCSPRVSVVPQMTLAYLGSAGSRPHRTHHGAPTGRATRYSRFNGSRRGWRSPERPSTRWRRTGRSRSSR